MFNERAFIARIEAADAPELVQLLANPSSSEERALRVYFGDDRYQRMHGLALKRRASRAPAVPRGNVVVIHGIMGGVLTAFDREGDPDKIWVNAFRIMAGRLKLLRLGDDGYAEYDPEYDTRATGILKRYYGELLLSLSGKWNVRAFWYDWRKDLDIAAAALEAHISNWFEKDTPVHVVAHSMGGLVARTFIKNYPDRWKSMWDGKSEVKGRLGGRLIMLGTPNHGSFVIPQVFTGLEGVVNTLAVADLAHSKDELLRVLNSFLGSYQMLPSPLAMPSMNPLYDAKTYGEFQVSQRHLDNARRHHEALREVVDPDRMIYIAGFNQPTLCNIKHFAHIGQNDAYEATLMGDGRVPHKLGLLETAAGKKVPTYYVDENHGDLTSNSDILAALEDLLSDGATNRLSKKSTVLRGIEKDAAVKKDALNQIIKSQAENEREVQALVGQLWSRGGTAAEGQPAYISLGERKLEESLTRGFLGTGREEDRRSGVREIPFGPSCIEIGLECGLIEGIDYRSVRSGKDSVPIDAIALGHYVGTRPQQAELALDRAISGSLPGRLKHSEASSPENKVPQGDLLLTSYADRGIIRGELGQLFFLPDPRARNESSAGGAERVIAIAGMGLPGRFGAPELALLSRELCWALGRMGKRHLATLLIGGGDGNLSVRDAISAWIRGVKSAVTGSLADEERRLLRITFVERDPERIESMRKAIFEEKRLLEEKDRLRIDYVDVSELDLKKKKKEWIANKEKAKPGDQAPTTITLALENRTYRLGAITQSASIPEREIPLDPKLVMDANDELAAEWDPNLQFERGQFLERLLIPKELRSQLYTDAPLVMLLDATTARIHWEVVAQAELDTVAPAETADKGVPSNGDDGEKTKFDPMRFLGTARGFTRQLRTTFAPPPEPPPPPKRIMRVLVVADPAEDARLPGAEAEGVEVAELFENFNRVWKEKSDNRIEVVRLFGPHEATRTNVLRHLMLRSHDVWHFAGHCTYDRKDPTSSGWIFSNGERLTANELNRIDRVPKFVFSNACESGVTPDRSEMRSVELAPGFAESFFGRGVANFVCTAWPVDDAAARLFALTLYASLLGLTVGRSGGSLDMADPEPMHVAMRKARLAIASTSNGIRCWGAYQHYGNPYFRFFCAAAMRRSVG